MIGYATLLVSINRALRSFGYYALVGELTSVFTALVLLPSLGLAWRHFVPREAELSPHPKGVAA
jgi:predicted RND superfamily exporter protein